MPSTRKKSPLTTSKKKKLSSSKPINKKTVGKKNAREQDLTVSNTDGSYLNEVSQNMSRGDELLNVQSLAKGTEAMLSILARLQGSNC